MCCFFYNSGLIVQLKSECKIFAISNSIATYLASIEFAGIISKISVHITMLVVLVETENASTQERSGHFHFWDLLEFRCICKMHCYTISSKTTPDIDFISFQAGYLCVGRTKQLEIWEIPIIGSLQSEQIRELTNDTPQ